MIKKLVLLCSISLSLTGFEKNLNDSEILQKNFEQIPLKIGTIRNNTHQNFIIVSSLGRTIVDLPAGACIKLNTIIEPLITPSSIKLTQNFILFILPANQKENLNNLLKEAKTPNEKQTTLLNFISVCESLNPNSVAYIHYQLSKERKNIALTLGLNNTSNFTYKIKPEYIKVKRILPSHLFTELRPLILHVTLTSLPNGSISPNSQLQLIPGSNNIKLYKAIEQRDFQSVKQQIRTLNLNMVDDQGNNPLHHAVKYGSPEVINLLLQAAPALVALKNYQGLTPVDLAAGNFDILQLFVLPHPAKQCQQ